MRVLVIGAGALGNEVLKNLALIGLGEIYLVDFDLVEEGNLGRSVLFRQEDVGKGKAEVAARRLKELNPAVSVKYLAGDVMHDLGVGLIRRMDAIIGCVDNRLARLWLNRWAFRAGKTWTSGGILQFSGQVVTYAPGRACYECGLSESAWRDIKQRMGCTDLAQRYLSQGMAPTTSIAASVIGAWQVQEALGTALGTSDNAGRIWSYEGLQRHVAEYELLPPKSSCDSHHLYGPIVEMETLSAESSLGECLDLLESEFGEEIWIELDHPVATEVATMLSKERHPVLLPLQELSEDLAEGFRKLAGEGVGVPKGHLHARLDRTFLHLDASLKDLGIPHLHVLRIGSVERQWYVELSKDLGILEKGVPWPRKKKYSKGEA